MTTDKRDYTDDELTAWLNGEFKIASSRELEKSMSLDSELRSRVSSLASDITAVQTLEKSPRRPPSRSPLLTARTAAIVAIALVAAIGILWLLLS